MCRRTASLPRRSVYQALGREVVPISLPHGKARSVRSIEPDDSAPTYARILDALPIVAFLARADGTLSYLSSGWKALTGMDDASALGDAYPAVIHPDYRAGAVATWLAACASGTKYCDEMPILFADGNYRWVLSQANPMRDPESNRIVGWFGTVTDIDDRKRVEETIRAQAELNRRLIESSGDGIATLDLEGRLVWVSANGQKMLGISDLDAAVGAPWPAFWDGEDRDAAAAAVRAALAGESGRFAGCLGAGEKRRFDVAVTAVHDAAGAPGLLLAVARDVTTQLGAVDALKESERRLRAYSEALPGITWSATAEGELDAVSDRWIETRGRDRTSPLGFGWLDHLHPDDRERAADVWRRSLATGEPYENEFRVKMADGAYRWQLVRALPTRSDAGEITRWVGVNVDVHEQHVADEARGMFVALTENSSDFIGICSPDGTMRYVNAAGRKLLDIGAPGDALASHLLDYFCGSDRDFVRRDVVPTVERHGQWTGDIDFRNFKTGDAVPVACNLFRLVDEGGRITGLATVSRDRRRRRRIEAGLRLLSRTGAASLGALDATDTLSNVAREFVPEFGTYCLIDVVSPEGSFRRTAVHADSDKERLLRGLPEPIGRHPVILALREGRSSLFVGDSWLADAPDRRDVVHALRLRSFVTVPVALPTGEIVGGLTCGRDDEHSAGDFDDVELAFVQEAARRAGAAIGNVRLYERERRIAVELQAASLPATLPVHPQLAVTAEYLPGSAEATIGGDWYDAFVLDDGRIAMTVGDVLGHGLQAAVTMSKLRQAMQTAAMIEPNPQSMLTVADKTLRLLKADEYSTALAAVYDPAARTLTFASAGHPGPIVRTPDGTVRAYASAGAMLGLWSAGDAPAAVVPLPPESTVVFFTDGLVEATRDLDAGYDRLHAAIASTDVVNDPQPARAIVQYCTFDLRGTDDIAVLVARTGPEDGG